MKRRFSQRLSPMESRVTGNCHARFGAGEKLEITSKVYLSLSFEMVAAAMESKRLGLCNKSLFVVPNHLTEQWAAEFLQLYPAAVSYTHLTLPTIA